MNQRAANRLWLISVFILAVVQMAPANAEDAPKSIKVPIFFATDRDRLSTDGDKVEFGVHRRPFTDQGDDPDLGVATIVTRNSAEKCISPQLKDRGWSDGSSESNGTWTATVTPGTNFSDCEQKFYERVRAELAASPDKTLFVFVPGYMSTFKSGLETSARIAYFTERPVVLYSWPSKGKFREYTSDEASIEWSQDHFNEFMDKLSAIAKDDPAIKFHIWAHSMGSRLALRAVPHLRENKAITELCMICPDSDAGLVMHYARRYYSANGTALLSLYMSHNDKMMSLSKLVHGGYLRMGEETDIGSALQQAVTSRNNQSPSAKALRSVAARVKTVDFTSIDRGGVGHRIPVKLMAARALNEPIPESIELVAPTDKGDCESSMILRVAPKDIRLLGKLRNKLPTKNLLFGKDWSLD